MNKRVLNLDAIDVLMLLNARTYARTLSIHVYFYASPGMISMNGFKILVSLDISLIFAHVNHVSHVETYDQLKS